MPAAYEAADLQRIFGTIKDRLRAIEELTNADFEQARAVVSGL